MSLRAAIYARTSTTDQEPENQLIALRDYCARREWPVVLEYIDAVSGATAAKPKLDLLLRDAKRGRFDVVVVWRLDRLGRKTGPLLVLLDELQAIGVTFASVNDGIDLSTAVGRFVAQILGSIAEYEREFIRDRVKLGLARARRNGQRIGRPPAPVTIEQIAATAHLSLTDAARQLSCSRALISKRRTQWRNGDASAAEERSHA